MSHLNGESLNIKDKNIEKLVELFPEINTDGKIDFEKLKQILGEYVDDSEERYRFVWNGKGEALRLSQTPSMGTLRPTKEEGESKNWDETENLYIEGDNLEVLKLLQKSYFNKIKMIYFDPPYNTGGDFVYKDNFKENIQNYKKITGQVDSEGNATTTNREYSGRYHTDWLNMMYPRLRLARNLLTNDGVVFISIDGNEVHNLKKICDEIFGEQNNMGEFIWSGGRKNDSKYISISHEYVLIYVKNKEYITQNKITWRERKEGLDAIYDKATELVKKCNNDYRKASEKLKEWYQTLDNSNPSKQHKHYNNIDERGVYFAGDISWPGGGGPVYEVVHPITNRNVKIPSRGWLFSKDRMKEMIENNMVHFGDDETKVPCFKRYLKETEYQVPYSVIYQDSRGAMKRLRELFGKKVFDFPKDENILAKLFDIITSKDDIIMDFFSGSASSAHAVMMLNAQDNGNRKFIMVQLPEPTDKKSEAYKAGYENIAEIGKERIRRAGEKVKKELKEKYEAASVEERKEMKHPDELDIGFKVFKLDSSNIKEWNPGKYENVQQAIEDALTPYVPDRTEEDVVYEMMLKMGLDLTYPVEEIDVNGKTIYSIGYGFLMICLADKVDIVVAEKMIEIKDDNNQQEFRAIFRDEGFSSDTDKTNVKETLRSAGLAEESFITL